MIDISGKTYKKSVESIVDKDGILWLNEKHIEARLGYKYWRMTTVKYLSDDRKHRYELVVGAKE